MPSPIPQGGLEIPLEVTFKYEDLPELSKIKELVTEHYDGFDKISEIDCEESDDECVVDL